MHLSLVVASPLPLPSASLRSPLRFVRLALAAAHLLLRRPSLSPRPPPLIIARLVVVLSFCSSVGCPSAALVRSAPAGRCPSPSLKLGARAPSRTVFAPRCCSPLRGVWVSTPPPLKGGERSACIFCKTKKASVVPAFSALLWCLRTRSRSLPTQKGLARSMHHYDNSRKK